MIARTLLFVFAATLVGGAAAPPADAGDYRLSFEYSSHSPRYYSASFYGDCSPRPAVYYDDCPPYATYYAPVVYDTCYPTTYRRTYTRSYYATRPVYHPHRIVHYRSGHHIRDHRGYRVHRNYYAEPRASVQLHTRPSIRHYRHDRSPAGFRIHRR